jgi:hypothetical protein
VIIRIDTNSNIGFHIWIPKAELSTLFLYLIGTTTIRADLIDMTQIQTKTRNH